MFDAESETAPSIMATPIPSDERCLNENPAPAPRTAVDDVSADHTGTIISHGGLPYLRCNAPHSAMLSMLDDEQPHESDPSVWVETGDCTPRRPRSRWLRAARRACNRFAAARRIFARRSGAGRTIRRRAELARWAALPHAVAVPAATPPRFSGLVLPPRGADVSSTLSPRPSRATSAPRPRYLRAARARLRHRTRGRRGAAARRRRPAARRRAAGAAARHAGTAARGGGAWRRRAAAAFERCAAWHVASDGDIAPTLQRGGVDGRRGGPATAPEARRRSPALLAGDGAFTAEFVAAAAKRAPLLRWCSATLSAFRRGVLARSVPRRRA